MIGGRDTAGAQFFLSSIFSYPIFSYPASTIVSSSIFSYPTFSYPASTIVSSSIFSYPTFLSSVDHSFKISLQQRLSDWIIICVDDSACAL